MGLMGIENLVLISGTAVATSLGSVDGPWASIVDETPGLECTTCWNPPDVTVDEKHPYYFPLILPGWDLERADYTDATLSLTYHSQYGLDIFLYAADPASDTSSSSSYTILLGTVPYTTPNASGTAQFDLLADLSTEDFNALFQGQDLLYLVADCHYVFDKACLHLDTAPVPVPPALLLLGSALLGLVGIRRSSRMN